MEQRGVSGVADGDETEPGGEPPAEAQSGRDDQDFFLALAAKGKDAWNAWRCDPANNERVTFAGIDFSEAPRDEINFAGFQFGHRADFSGCKWRGADAAEMQEDLKGFKQGRACFTGAAFGNGPRFGGAAFGNWATFDSAGF